MRMARVTRRDFDGKINVVTTVNQTASTSIEDVLAPGAEKLMCSTRQEMMEAVRNGKADAAFVYYYMAQAWKPFSNPRSFAKYGRQRGWERIPPPDNEPSATGSNLTDGFRELTEEEARQMELPF